VENCLKDLNIILQSFTEVLPFFTPVLKQFFDLILILFYYFNIIMNKILTVNKCKYHGTSIGHLVHCDICSRNNLTPSCNIHRFNVHPPLQGGRDVTCDIMSTSVSCIVTFRPQFPVVLWVELSQLTWNFSDVSSVTFRLMNNQTYVHNLT
jgi:hypothetical protein